MLAVNDMFMTSKRNVTSFFIEDVQAFFEANRIRYMPRVEFTGKSGYIHHFDFAIPKSPSAPERLVKAINQPTKENTLPVLFAWTDTKAVRPPDSQAYVIMNDADKELKPDILTAFGEYGIKTISWSERQRFVSELVA